LKTLLPRNFAFNLFLIFNFKDQNLQEVKKISNFCETTVDDNIAIDENMTNNFEIGFVEPLRIKKSNEIVSDEIIAVNI